MSWLQGEGEVGREGAREGWPTEYQVSWGAGAGGWVPERQAALRQWQRDGKRQRGCGIQGIGEMPKHKGPIRDIILPVFCLWGGVWSVVPIGTDPKEKGLGSSVIGDCGGGTSGEREPMPTKLKGSGRSVGRRARPGGAGGEGGYDG